MITIEPMEISIQKFSEALASEDDLGMILRGHLHIEHQLKEFISLFLPFNQKCDWGKIGYIGRVEIALSCGLPEDMRKPLEKINSIRNCFAHELNTVIQKQTVMDIYNCLSERHQNVVKLCYKELGGKETFSPSQLEKIELLQILIVSIHSAILAAILDKQ